MNNSSDFSINTVVVTGVGAIIGQGIVKALRSCSACIRIVGIDRNKEGVGQRWCDAFYAKPNDDEGSPEYLAFWQDVIRREGVALVLPGLEVDVQFLLKHRAALESDGCKIVLNNPDLIELSSDKWLFGEELEVGRFPRIPATLERTWPICRQILGEGPLLLKPRCGNGSRGIQRIEDETDFQYWSLKSSDKFVIQKYIGSDEMEFTVGAFGLGDGRTMQPIIFRRKLSVAGNTQYAEVISNEIIMREVVRLASHFKPLGPTNYQFRLENETPYLLEINPRFSSSTSLRASFGYNEAAMCLAWYLDGRAPEAPIVSYGKAWRYFEDYVQK